MTGTEVVLFRKANKQVISENKKLVPRETWHGGGCMLVLDKGDITIYRYHCIGIKDVNESRQNSEQKLQ